MEPKPLDIDSYKVQKWNDIIQTNKQDQFLDSGILSAPDTREPFITKCKTACQNIANKYKLRIYTHLVMVTVLFGLVYTSNFTCFNHTSDDNSYVSQKSLWRITCATMLLWAITVLIDYTYNF
jgi:hypothetical protein